MELQHVFFWVIRMFIAKMLHTENIKMCFTKMLHAENIKMCFIGVLSLIIATMKIFLGYLTLLWLEFSR